VRNRKIQKTFWAHAKDAKGAKEDVVFA